MICRIYNVEGGSLEDYDAVVERTGSDKPKGVRLHVAGATDGAFKVIEVWDSIEDVNRYMDEGLGEAIGQVMREAGVDKPTITEFEVHRLDWIE
jgi:hypothetical protein